MLAMILLIATIGLPLAFLYGYNHFYLQQNYKLQVFDVVALSVAGSLQLAFAHWQYSYLSYIPANFLHHAIGGGFVVAIMWWVVQRRLWPTMLWPIRLVLLVAIVNVLGNANEVLELLAELLTGKHYAVSRLDTMIDIVANNTGALVGFAGLTMLNKFVKVSN